MFEQVGELDILINDVWGGDDVVEWRKKLWATKLEDGLKDGPPCQEPPAMV